MPQFLAPICNDQLIDVNGDPLVGGQIETYLAGSTTPAQTYTDDSGSVPQSNPIILNSLGYTPNPIWLTGGVSYKFVIKNAAGVIQRTVDDVAGVNDASVSQSEWVDSGFVPTYINPTSFSVPGDQTTVLQVGRRVRTTNTSGLVYSTISNSVFAAGITTVTLTNDSTTLDPGLSGVAYALLAASPLSVPDLPPSKLIGLVPVSKGGTGQSTAPGIESILPINQTRVDVASAATVNLTTGAASTDHINITGTTTITAFTVAAGRVFFVRFAAALTLTNNASIVTQTGVNIATQAGDTCILRATAANVVEVLSYSALSKISNGAAATLTNQTAIDFTGIPSWVNRVNAMFAGVSTNGGSPVVARLGTSGGIESTGYLGAGSQSTASTVGSANETTGVLLMNGIAAAVVFHGAITFQRISGNTWVAHGVTGRSDAAAASMIGFSKTLSGVLDRIRFTTVGGTDQFDAGTINVSWE